MQRCLLFLIFMQYLLQRGTCAIVKNNTTGEILIENFAKQINPWEATNDAEMGGKSESKFTIQGNAAVFTAKVVDNPFSHKPGYVELRVVSTEGIFPDVSACQSLQLDVRTDNPDFTGYHVSFGNAHAPDGEQHAYGFKAKLQDLGRDYANKTIPFTDFTDDWDDETGDPIHTCYENGMYCPDRKTLKNMKTIAVWAQGVDGDASLMIKSIQAVGCSTSTNNKPHFLRSFTGVKFPINSIFGFIMEPLKKALSNTSSSLRA